MLGVHGNGLTHLIWMPPTPRSAVIEMFFKGGFARDCKFLEFIPNNRTNQSRSMDSTRTRYTAFRGSTRYFIYGTSFTGSRLS